MEIEKISGFPKQTCEKRYQGKDEDPVNMVMRVATAISSRESNSAKDEWIDKYKWIIGDLLFIPAGRILRNAGTDLQFMVNCAALAIEDNIESIMETLKLIGILSSYGAGMGINWSPLRPAGDYLNTRQGEASGPVSFMTAGNAIAHTIKIGGDRRAAILGLLEVAHPELRKYIRAKIKEGQLENFNISVGVTNSFLKDVKAGKDWPFTFRGKDYGHAPADKLWREVIHCMFKMGDPGAINMNNLIKNNSWYFAPIVCTNACAELPLSHLGSCFIGSINLAKFISMDGKIDYKLLKEVINIAIRFLDSVIDINYFPLSEMAEVAENTRRIGLGGFNEGNMLFKCGIRYGSMEHIELMDDLRGTIMKESYLASIELAKEKGVFPKFDKELYCQSSFVRKLPRGIQRKIKEHGIRNVTMLTSPPTGTSSILAGPGTTSGIEPLFAKAFWRRSNVKDSEKSYHIHPIYKDYLEGKTKKLPTWFVDAHDIAPREHLEVVAGAQKYNDSAVSKTINLPEDFPEEDLFDLSLEYLPDIKSFTIYRNNSRKIQVLNPLTEEQTRKHLKKMQVEEDGVFCKDGVCEL